MSELIAWGDELIMVDIILKRHDKKLQELETKIEELLELRAEVKELDEEITQLCSDVACLERGLD